MDCSRTSRLIFAVVSHDVALFETAMVLKAQTGLIVRMFGRLWDLKDGELTGLNIPG